MSTRIKFRRGNASEWTSGNPILSAGEPGFEKDTGKFKIGNGTDQWTSLDYAGGGQVLPQIVELGSVSGTINTNVASGNIFDFTLIGSGNLAAPTNAVDGTTIRWRIFQDSSGNRPLSFNNKFNIPSTASNPLPISTASGKMDILGATYDSQRDKWDVIAFVPGY